MHADSIRLLLVEDDPGDADRLAAHIADVPNPHLELIRVERIADALSKLEQDAAIDAVLLDLGLPDSEGVDSVKRVLGARPDVPIVVLTGLDSDEVGIRAVQQGAQDYLVKGAFDGWAITRSVLYAIERSRLKAQVRLIVMRNVDAMLVVSPDSTIRYVNRAALQLFERSHDELVGASFPYSLSHSSTTQIEIGGPDGERKICEMRLARIDWVGELAFLASIRDITELRPAHELEQPLAASDRQAAAVAHPISNPVTFVRANVARLGEMVSSMANEIDALRARLAELGDSPLTAFEAVVAEIELLQELSEVRETLDECSIGCDRIASSVKELASFSRIERETCATLAPEQSRQPATRAPAAGVAQRRLRVLVIDDEVIIRRSLRRILQTRHDVVTAASGDDAIDLLRDDPAFDAIVCDMMMPELDGPGVYEALREARPELLDRLIFLTGGVFNARAQDFIDRHRLVVLEKPTSMASLMGALQQIASRS